MSIQAVAWVLQQSESRGFARLVLISLANHTNDDGLSWPAMRTIADEAGVSVSSVHRQVAKLVELGEITIAEQGTARRSTRYLLPFAQRSPVERSVRPKAERSVPARVEQIHKEPSGNSPAADEPPPARKPRARTPRDDLFDALVNAFGPASTPARGAFYGRTVRELIAAGATPELIRKARIAMSRRGWDHPTPEAMVKHWDDLIGEPEGPTNPAARRFWETA